MNRNEALKQPSLFLLALGCFACSTFVGAQQTSGLAPVGSAPAAAATPSGVYSIDSRGPARDSMGSLEDRIGSKDLIPYGSLNSGSTWMAGVNNTSPAGASVWKGSQANFSGASGSSWNAGAHSFGLQRQQGG